MELGKAENFAASFEGFTQLPLVRQLALMLGAAASIALIMVVFLWSQDEGYRMLYGNLPERERAQIVDILQQRGIDYKLDENTGAVMVASGEVHNVRLQLAGEGLPKSSGVGFDILQKEPEFGTSQFIENARYQHALEVELAETIASVGHVESARVHLAMPKQSVFVRKRQQPSASVAVNLYRGRQLEDEQVASITHLVASSIPNMSPENVTVVDQHGRLLTRKNRQGNLGLNQDQFEYTRQLEESYVQRIENILAPLVGLEGVRAQVTADMDFTVTEQTQEMYNPDLPALRSEQRLEEKSSGPGVEGVPGALSNQPPGDASVPEQATGENAQANGRFRSRKQTTANYELDRTISHSRLASGTVNRLSVAVVVNDRMVTNEEGELVPDPWPAEELDRMEALVREAVGYSAQRGDTVNLVNAAFHTDQVEALPEPPLWQQPWVWDIGRKAAGGIMVLLFLIAVLRPLLRSLAQVKPPSAPVPAGAGEEGVDGLAEDQVSIGSDESSTKRLPSPDQYDEDLQMVRQVAQEDPKRVAQVVRSWVASEGGQ